MSSVNLTRRIFAAKSLRIVAAYACAALLMLSGRSALAVRSVSGMVDSTWSRQDALIRVVGDIYIPNGRSLTIEPGVRVQFEGNFSLTVDGLLDARGQADTARHIVFSGNGVWRGIVFNATANPASQLVECDISNAWVGVQIIRCFVTIERCRISALTTGINCIHSSPDIINNHIIRAGSENTQSDVKAISLYDYSAPRITGNDLIEAVATSHGIAYGIWMFESTPPFLDGNNIKAVGNDGAVGIYARRTAKLRIDHNVIETFSNILLRGIWMVQAGVITFVSNDVFLNTTCDNAVGILVDVGSITTIINNIIYGNGGSVGDSTVNGEVTDGSGYNDYYLHSINHVGNWQGANEINADPLFIDRSADPSDPPYQLSLYSPSDTIHRGERGRSPCIDAGDPSLHDAGDSYNTRSDIGRFFRIYNPADTGATSVTPVTDPIVRTSVLNPAFPNPFNRATVLSFDLALPGRASVTVYDLNGRLVQTLWNSTAGSGRQSLVWSAAGLSAGEYFVRLDATDRSETIRLLYLP